MERMKIQISFHSAQSYRNNRGKRTVKVTKWVRSLIRVSFISIFRQLTAVGSSLALVTLLEVVRILKQTTMMVIYEKML